MSPPSYPNACATCGVRSGEQCVSLTSGRKTDTHKARIQNDIMNAPTAEQVHVVKGIELPYATRRHSVYGNASELSDKGVAFVSYQLLDELSEADNSWGGGGAFLVNDSHAQAALECAGLIRVETRGGVYTDDIQRAKIDALLTREYGS